MYTPTDLTARTVCAVATGATLMAGVIVAAALDHRPPLPLPAEVVDRDAYRAGWTHVLDATPAGDAADSCSAAAVAQTRDAGQFAAGCLDARAAVALRDLR